MILMNEVSLLRNRGPGDKGYNILYQDFSLVGLYFLKLFLLLSYRISLLFQSKTKAVSYER